MVNWIIRIWNLFWSYEGTKSLTILQLPNWDDHNTLDVRKYLGGFHKSGA